LKWKYSAATDVSKDKCQWALSVIDSEQKVTIKATKTFANTYTKFAEIEKWLSKKTARDLPLCITMEATGVYHEQLAWFLHSKGYRLSIVLPTKSKRYMQALGLKSKNDSIDARGLSRMGAEQNPDAWKPPSEQLCDLKKLTRHHESLQNLKTQISNQLHALSHSQVQNKLVTRQLKNSIKLFEKQIKVAEEQIKKLITGDPELHRRVKNLLPVKGVGMLTIATIIAETDGFVLFKNKRQLTSYAGYDVIENQSGKHMGKTKMSKKGNSHIRRILHMPALSAVTHQQQPFKALFERVFERSGIKMKGYVAVQRKLLIIMYGIWKNDQVFDPQHEAKAETNSGNNETKVLFQKKQMVDTASKKASQPQAAKKTKLKKGGLTKNPPSLDELPYNKSTGLKTVPSRHGRLWLCFL